ncbi:unnamed protein product, partial [marine sediment metagenome]
RAHFWDIGNPDAQNWVVGWIGEKLERGYNGIFADTGLYYGLRRGDLINPVTGEPTNPINPRTGQLYTDEEWIDDLITLHQKIKAAHPECFVMAGDIFYGPYWADPEKQQIYKKQFNQAPFDGFISEGIFTRQQIFLPTTAYLQGLDLVDWVRTNWIPRGKYYGVWSKDLYNYPDHTMEEMVDYIIASTLLVAGPEGFYVRLGGRALLTEYAQSRINQDFGTPLGGRYPLNEAIYARDFTKTKVITNPTESSHTITLDKEYLLNGVPITEVTMRDHSGVMLE